jgi:hypothetical protein
MAKGKSIFQILKENAKSDVKKKLGAKNTYEKTKLKPKKKGKK